ncbi:glycerol-3-phosphate 1-O-acyltransferase PlsY [Coprothermobacter platensis]|uniref:glycerol-3-phosphate 1-O-acyltransferase PlsY n=1 Tax=Coprothermobacter platensis TaxID=108819 RepID=UPI0003764117|nr:glycerol-3-phosphate 1-O-acyltransferase PlsY [Coprothermobacter platensis]
MIVYWLCVVGAYLWGALPFGYIIGLTRGIDITKVGSGNIGATNVYRVMGVSFALVTFLFDMSKGLIPALLAFHLFGDLSIAQQWILFLSPIIGHCISPFLHFKGGKGVAASFGALLGFDIRFALIFAIVWGITFIITRWVSLGSLLGLWAAFAVGCYLLPYTPWALLFLAAFITWRHHENISRLLNGKENRLALPWEKNG